MTILEVSHNILGGFMHNAPRFGHSRSISQLASQDPSRVSDYKTGLIAFSSLILTIVLCWFFALIYFKFGGTIRYGLLSGRVSYTSKDRKEIRARQRHLFAQVAALLCAGGIIAGSALLLLVGIPQIEDATIEMIELNTDINLALMNGLKVAKSADYIRQNLKRTVLLDYITLERYCVGNDVNQFLTDEMNDLLSSLSSSLNTIEGYLDKHEIELLKTSLSAMTKTSDQIGDVFQTSTEYQWVPKMFTLLLCCILSFMLGNIFLSCLGKPSPALARMTAWITLPSFTTLIIIGWIVSVFIGVLSICIADYCVGGKFAGSEGTVQEAMLEFGIKENDLTYQSFLYYQSDCTIDNPWNSIVMEYGAEMQLAIDSANIFVNYAEKVGVENLTLSCGKDFGDVINEIQKYAKDVLMLMSNLEEALELARCSRVSPLHKRVFRGATCNESMTGITNVFFALFFLTFSGMLLITFRASLYEVKEIRFDDEWDEKTHSERWADFEDPFALDQTKSQASYETDLTLKSSSEEYDSNSQGIQVATEMSPLSPRHLDASNMSRRSRPVIASTVPVDKSNHLDQLQEYDTIQPVLPHCVSKSSSHGKRLGDDESIPLSPRYKIY